MTLLGRRMATLGDDERAALSPLIGFVLLFFAWIGIAVLDTGEIVRDRARAQNAVDAAVLAHAEETARSLDTMAMNNVAGAQLTAVSIVAAAMIETLADIQLRAGLAHVDIFRSEIRQCTGKWWWVVICLAMHETARLQVIAAEIEGVAIALRYRPWEALATAGRLIEAFDRMNRHLVDTHPRRAGALGRRIAEANGAAAIVFHPPCRQGVAETCRGGPDEGGDLPVERGGAASIAAHVELCTGLERGSDGRHRTDWATHGFPLGRGPWTAGGAGSTHLRDWANRASGIGRLLHFFGDVTLEGWNWLIGFRTPPRWRERQQVDRNAFTRALDDDFRLVCGPGGLLAAVALPGIALPRPYWLAGRSPATALAPDAGLLGLDHPEVNAILAVVARDRGPRAAVRATGEPDEPTWAHAQALVYNPVSFDLWTARWKARLVPARLMDHPLAVAETIADHDRDGRFAVLTRILETAGDQGEWARVNTH